MKYFAALFVSATLISAADIRNGQAAWAVIGQPTFTSQNVPPSQSVAGTPGGVAWANGHLLVAEGNRIGAITTNADGTVATVGNRITIFNANSGNYLPDPHTDPSVTGNVTNQRCTVCGFPAQTVLGQSDFNGTDVAVTSTGMRNPTAVASDGTVVAVADTDNNRVLIWKSFPTSNGQAADVVLGQPDFTTVTANAGVKNNTLRGPQGVWIQNGKLFVADTQNDRVLIWNSIPTQNQQPADIVLGQKDFNSAAEPNPNNTVIAAANQLYSPTSVTSDGTRLYVSDLGFNRVLIWNAIPSSNTQAADVVVGQPDFNAATANNTPQLCASNGTDSDGNPTYPALCEKSLDLPRFALSDGQRLFIADGGNDRVLVYNTIPTTNGVGADRVLGQPDYTSDVVSDPTISFASTIIPNRASTDTIRTPTSLAWDGTNLYVTDPYDLRVMVFTAGDNTSVGSSSILNAASLAIYQEGVVTLGGVIHAGDTVTITVGLSGSTKDYTYTVQDSDTMGSVGAGLASLINANGGDANVTALADTVGDVLLTSRQSQLPNSTISLSASVSSDAQITATASGSYLTGGNAAIIAPGTIVVINGTNLTNGDSQSTPSDATSLPTSLAGAQVFMDGQLAPLISATHSSDPSQPDQIKAQVPYTFQGSSSASVYVRITPKSGPVQVTAAAPLIIAQANPGLFAGDGNDPRPVMAVHSSDHASSVVSVDGSVTANDTGTITIGSNSYTYTVTANDTLSTVRDNLIAKINSGSGDPNVIASAGGQFTRVVLTARNAGSSGNGISVAASVSDSASLVLTAYTSATCCASTPGAPVTPSNPAQPNETISLIATGLGPLTDAYPIAGFAYNGSVPNTVTDTVSATVGSTTAQVINAGLPTNAIGLYSVDIVMPSGLAANSATQIYIAQDAFVSNIATIPVAGTTDSSLVTFTASPNVIVTNGESGQTTLTWNATNVQNVEVHIGSPTGPLFAAGGSSGTATTGNWVTNGTTFYLEDVTNGKTPNTVNTLATLTIQVGTAQSVTSFTATDVNLPPGLNAGPTTLSWSAPTATSVEVHVGSPTGPLLSTGNSTGSATTGNWVTPGTSFYLVDVSNASSPVVLASRTPNVSFNVAPSFSINPNPIYAPYSAQGLFGTATLTWNSPLTPHVEVHAGSPDGPRVAYGDTTGSATATGWVSDGTQFFLVDPATGATLNQVTAHVLLQSESGYLLAQQNPVQGTPGQFSSAVLQWSTSTATQVEVHVGAPNGPLFSGGGPQSTAIADGWVSEGTQFFLQDVSSGQPLTSQFTIATQTISFTPTVPNTSFQASPNPILVSPGTQFGKTTLYWTAPSWVVNTEIHIGAPDGPLLTHGIDTGSMTTGDWVSDGTVFFLQDVTKDKPLTWAGTLATVTVHLKEIPPGQ